MPEERGSSSRQLTSGGMFSLEQLETMRDLCHCPITQVSITLSDPSCNVIAELISPSSAINQSKVHCFRFVSIKLSWLELALSEYKEVKIACDVILSSSIVHIHCVQSNTRESDQNSLYSSGHSLFSNITASTKSQ